MMAKRNLFHGTMNASKSAQLLMQAYNLERQGKTFVIFKPETDTRDGEYVRSRALGERRPAHLVNRLGIITSVVTEMHPDFIFADETQFFSKELVDELTNISIITDTPVFAYGLLLDYTGKLFEGSRRAIENGYTLHELKMQCDFCKSKSTHHLLYIDGQVVKNGSGIHVGDTEYKSVCYECFVDESKK